MPELTVIEDNGRKDVVEMLASMLERAKRGEIRSLAVAGILTGNCVITAFRSADDGDKFGLLGAISHVEHRLNTCLDNLDVRVTNDGQG